ncbi:MAG: HAMP domain-containing sensor histidine kinase [Candidatus Saccharibacteria bacterium]|nr:HAMP domain-containing sensor histidine kinase [Candidatus Saccharibacteria bacterium]
MAKEVDGVFVVAHELKSPLALTRQLALSIEPEDIESVKFAKEKIISTTERAMRQVNDLTKVARLEDGLFTLEPVSVRGVCDDVARELRYLYRENHKSLREKYTNRSKLATANREMLYSVIYNFCSNSLRYSDEETRSELSVRDRGDKIEVSVRDFGPALPVNIWKELKHGWISEPTSIAMRPGSSGLGLYIASKFARFMNGEVSAIRHRDGTSFILRLPISKQASLF